MKTRKFVKALGGAAVAVGAVAMTQVIPAIVGGVYLGF
jgi:hypothetical protein